MNKQPYITTADGKRKFACSAVAVLVFIVNEEEKILHKKEVTIHHARFLDTN